MNFLCLYSSPNPLISTLPSLHKTTRGILETRNAIPARDRVIDFGKYRGKKLGTLPSNYLKWVSKNLRAREFLDWAKLADEVLDDPVYRDRIEWEFAERVLNGDVLSSKMMFLHEKSNAVSGLLEVSERFGWDNEDKVGWAKVDFGLLGTSKGGRIPRLGLGWSEPKRYGGLEIVKPNLGGDGPVEDRRRERRERLKAKGRKNGVENGEGLGGNSSEQKLEGNQKGFFDGEDHNLVQINKSVFPGRDAFLKKVLNRRS